MHSLHAYFLRPGDPQVPIVYEVDRIRDGRSFTTRRVVAIQHGTRHLQPGGVVPRRRARSRPPGRDARRRPTPSRCRRSGSGSSDDELEPIDRQGSPHVVDAIDMRHVGTFTPPGGVARRTGARPRAGHVVPQPTARCPTTRCCTRASSRTRPTSRCSTPRCCRTRSTDDDRLHDREPRPRDVVPPPVPRRRLAAVPPAQPVGRGAAAGSPTASSSAHDGTLAVTRDAGRPHPAGAAGHDAARDESVDLRSDTVTTPTPEMRRGDGRRRGRRRRLRRGPDRQPAASRSRRRCSARRPRSTCRRARWRTSSRSACSARPAPRCCAATRAHVYRYERAAAPVNAGVQLRPLPDADGRCTRRRRRTRSRAPRTTCPRSSRCSRSRTRTCPRVGRADRRRPRSTTLVRRRARRRARGALDGARIWNAADRARRVAGDARRGVPTP